MISSDNMENNDGSKSGSKGERKMVLEMGKKRV